MPKAKHFIINPNSAKLFSQLIHAGERGPIGPPPLSPVIAVIKGQTKKLNDHVLQENKL